MQSQQFQEILNAIPLLTSQQKNSLLNALSDLHPPFRCCCFYRREFYKGTNMPTLWF